MKSGLDAHGGWKLEADSRRANDRVNVEGTYVFRSQFF